MKDRSLGFWIITGGLVLLGVYLAFLPNKRLSPNSFGDFFKKEPAPVSDAFDYEGFSRIPVLRGGRVKPLDSVARNCLLVMSNKRAATREKADGSTEKVPAIEWFAEVLLRPEEGNKLLTFLIDHDQVLGLLGIRQGDKKRFSYTELEEHFAEIEDEAKKAGELEGDQRGPFEQNVLDLYRSLQLYRKLQNTLQPPPAPPSLAADEEFGLQEVLRRAEVEPGHAPEYERFRALAKSLADDPSKIAPGSKEFARFVAMMDRYSNWTLFAEFHAIPPRKGSSSPDWSRIGETLVGTDARHAEPSMMRDLDFRSFPAQIRELVALEPEALIKRIEELRDEHKMNPNVLFATKYADAIKLRGEVDPIVEEWENLALAYGNNDASTFNAGVDKLRQSIDERTGEATATLGFEKAFNGYEPFYRSLIVYVIAMLVACLSWLVAAGSDKEKKGGSAEHLRQAAFWLMVIAFAAHTFGLFARMYVQGRPPVTTLYSSALFIGWAAVLLCVFLERYHKFGIASAMGSFLGFGALIIAHNLSLDSSLNPSGDTMEMMRAVLDDNFWLATHVVTVTIGYSTTFLAGFVAIAFVLLHVLNLSFGGTEGIGKKLRAIYTRMEKDAGAMIYGVTCFALFFSFVGTVLGGIWADQSWGRFWGWDAKENGAILIVLWNAIILHARWGGMARTRGIACLAIFGNIVTSWSWFGTNMLGVGLHSYGFMDKAFVPLMVFILVQLGLIVLGSLPKPSKQSAKEADIKHNHDEDRPTAPRTSRMAIASFWLAILGLSGPGIFMRSAETFLFGPGGLWNIVLVAIPIYLGHRARAKIRRSEGKLTGNGFALAGLIIGYLTLLIFLKIALSTT